jgi:phosphate-induced protein 1
MRSKHINSLMMLVTVALCAASVLAQNAPAGQTDKGVKTDSKMAYHNGPVMSGAADVYVIWYGCWDEICGNGNTATQEIITDFLSNIGGSPYFQINAMYANGSGQAASGATFFGGQVYDQYSQGLELTSTDIAEVVENQIVTNGLPQDPAGIWLVIASADVSSVSTGLCTPSALPYHGRGEAFGSDTRYAFVGNPNRCPTVAASQFFANGVQLPTPNNNLAADAMASTVAHLLSRVVTNPVGGAWFDRYGLENASKCVGQFGPTYSTANSARANLRLGSRDYLIQQNWVLGRKEHCAMNSSL